MVSGDVNHIVTPGKEKAVSVELYLEPKRYVQAGGVLQVTAVISSNTDLYGLKPELQMPDEFVVSAESTTVDLPKNTPVEFVWTLSARESTPAGLYRLTASVKDENGLVRVSRTSDIQVEGAMVLPVLEVEIPPPSVIQDRVFWMSRKVFSYINRSTYLIIALSLAVLSSFVLYRRIIRRRYPWL